MPFRVDKNKDNEFLLFNINKKRLVQKVFKSKESAINFGKNSIKFREKKDSKVSLKNGKTFILPK